jgi:VanZ family protein
VTPVPWLRFWWALGAVLVVLAAYICLAPGQEIPGSFELNDKVSHGFGHFVLTIYFCGLVPRVSWYKIAIFLLAFGIGIEIAQHFMHVGRQADRYDVLANSVGMTTGLLLSHLGLHRWPRWVAWTLGERSVS